MSLPGQVRVYTPFAYDANDESVGRISELTNIRDVAERLAFLRAEAIDSGDIWRHQAHHLSRDRRVDRALLSALMELSGHLINKHDLSRDIAHALVGRFVYLYYLRDRDILSDQWLTNVGVSPDAVFSANATLDAFRRLADAVDERFNGHIFPIDWSSASAPTAESVRVAGEAFSGGGVWGQRTLFRMFEFEYIPIELLSAIYERFLHDAGQGAEHGAFYTPEPVADYLLAEFESIQSLRPGVRVLDPCCGSGIFLVLAFRRLVEQELRQRKATRLTPTELRRIMQTSIFGVERNRDACLVSEFSLILTLLSYIDPPELHRPPNLKFQFPNLHNTQIFEADFFDDDSAFWRSSQTFDCIIGNPPWKELDTSAADARLAILWMNRNRADAPVARYRIGEAFTWRVLGKLSDRGTVALLTQATSLTNDTSEDYRRAFFSRNVAHRITNFSNLAYVLFESAEEPAATLVYSPRRHDGPASPDIIHFGPLVVNQPALATPTRHQLTPWVLTMSESEIQSIRADDAALGYAATWKRALWGNAIDHRVLSPLRRAYPTTLGALAKRRGWSLGLGLQLRDKEVTAHEANLDVASIQLKAGASPQEAEQYARWFAELKVVQPKHLAKASRVRLTVPDGWLVPNTWGTFIRERGGSKGLALAPAPHVFLWNEFAAFSDKDAIFRHPNIGLSASPEDADWLRAISVLWTSSITAYCLFLDLSAGWGVSRSTIDLGDAEGVPMPELTDNLAARLAELHRTLEAEEAQLLYDATSQRERIDDAVATALSLPPRLVLLAREFSEFRLPLVKGKTPPMLTQAPNLTELACYAATLKSELDNYIERGTRRHSVSVLNSSYGIVATIELMDDARLATVSARNANADEHASVRDVLRVAEQRFGQWVYVRRGMRVFSGRKIHICKPPRRLEWSNTQALLDAADIIAEVMELRRNVS